MNQIDVTRRTFLVTASAFAGGMALSLAPSTAQAAAAKLEPWDLNTAGAEFSPWIVIAPDDTVIVRVAQPEIGNGARSQTPMCVAEELGCDWSKVRAEFAPVHRDFLEKGIYSKVGGYLPYFAGHGTDTERMKLALQVGASARERLKAAAAQQWRVPVAEIEAHNSVLTHTPSGRKLRFGEVAAKAAAIKLAAEPALKPQSAWTFLGKASPPKLNLTEMVNGTAVFGMDVQLPGKVYAALMQAPVHGGRLKHHDPSAVLKMPGVRAVVVVDPSKSKNAAKSYGYDLFYGVEKSPAQSAVAVIADHYWQAKRALDALPVEWDRGPGAAWKTNEQLNDAFLAELDKPPQKIEHTAGDLASVKTGKLIEARYHTPYCDNGVMEPLNGTAMFTPDKVEVWHPSQEPLQATWITIDETGLPPEKVHFHQTFVGGGFGRRVRGNDVRMVVAVAKEYPGVPVHTIWSREETTRQGRYRTMMATRFSARLDDKGMPAALDTHACGVETFSIARNYGDSPYIVSGAIPNVQVGTSVFATHLLTGAYRGPWYNSFSFMLETFVDECAVAAGVDPLEYRLRLLSTWDPAWSKCLQVAADKSGWGTPLPKGQGRGIAISAWPTVGVRQSGSIVCAVAKVEVTPKGVLHVRTVDFAFDCGRVAHRDAVTAQIEGGVIFGLNMTLNEEVTLQDGAVVEGNFDQYRILRIGDGIPKINVHFDALSGHDRFSMIGEAPVGPIGPAVGNAIFQATGKRLRTTPFRKHDLSWA